MYEEFFGHFGLQRNPFHVSPDPKRFFSTVAHDEALLQLVFGIESRKGLLVMTGEPGTGKTTILKYLLEWLGQYKYSTAYVFHSMLPSRDLLQLILRDFGISCASRNKSDMLGALKDWLVKRNAEGDCPVVIIDEAQALTTNALEDLRMLLNAEDGAPLLQLLLAGQPQLEEKLRHRKLAQLRQRIMCHCRLRPLTLGETAGYIGSRLTGAGAVGVNAFPQEAIADIYRYAKGIPRVVNLFCEHSLLAAYADRRDAISCNDVQRVAQQFDFAEECGDDARPFREDTFCRLIPFPKLATAEAVAIALPGAAAVVPETGVAAFAAGVEQHVTVEEAILHVAPQTVTRNGGQIEIQAAVALARAKAGWMSYWGGVATSFARDCHEFAGQCLAWLRTPVRTVWGAGTKKLIGAVQGWLRVPIGSTHISGQARRIPSAAHKHF
jgi:general secretion pathway protein A